MYEKVESRLNHFRIQASLLLISLVPLFLIYFLKFDESGKWIMLVLFGIAGFCVGANYDVYVTHESILSSNNNRQHILKNNSIVCGGLHVWVGLTQLLFGFASAASNTVLIQMGTLFFSFS